MPHASMVLSIHVTLNYGCDDMTIMGKIKIWRQDDIWLNESSGGEGQDVLS